MKPPNLAQRAVLIVLALPSALLSLQFLAAVPQRLSATDWSPIVTSKAAVHISAAADQSAFLLGMACIASIALTAALLYLALQSRDGD